MNDYMKNWNEFWSSCPAKPMVNTDENTNGELYGGTNVEPAASIGMSCFLEPVRQQFQDGFKILDYGCGAGILANFISNRIDSFTYVGLEPNNQHGNERIAVGKKFFNDERVTFGFIDDVQDLNVDFDCIVLISVFTHLTIENTYKTLDQLLSVVGEQDTKIIFSCFISDSYQLILPQPSIAEDFYGITRIKMNQLTDYAESRSLKLTRVTDFLAGGGHIHNIFSLEKK